MDMKNIISYALKHGEINKDMLVAMVREMDEEMAVRFTEAILGIAVPKAVPQASNVEGCQCRLLGYNYLKDCVDYEYEEEVTRYFKTEKEADEFSDGKSYRWAGERRISDEYKYEGKYVFTNKSTCQLSRWLEGAK